MDTNPAPQNCILTGLVAGEEYQIELTTVNEFGESPRSPVAIAFAATVPGAPSNIRFTASAHTPASLTIQWDVGTDQGAIIYNYELAVSLASGSGPEEVVSMGGTLLT